MAQSVLTPGGMVTLPATGFGDTGVTTAPVSASWATGSVAWCCSNWWVPVGVSAGDVVGSVAALVQDVAPSPLYIPGSQGDGGSSVVLSVVAQTGNTSTTLGTASSNGSGAQQSLIVTLASPYTVPPGTSVVLKAAAFALWPSSVMHSSIVGPVTTAAPQIAGPSGTRTIKIPIPAPTARTGGAAPAAALQSGAAIWIVASTGELVYPLPVYVGDVITGFRVFGNKQSGSGTRLAATLMTAPSAGGAVTGSATASNQNSAPGPFVLTVTGLSTVAAAGNSYVIQADSTTGSNLDIWTDAEVTITR